MRPHAAVAQLVEQRIRNAKVASSTPASGTNSGPTRAPERERPVRIPFFPSLLIAIGLALPFAAAAEDDGNELLAFIQKKESRDVALMYIDAVRAEWNGRLFCIEGDDLPGQAFTAVRQYLETHPDELFRPRRYLIIQGLRAGHPCRKS